MTPIHTRDLANDFFPAVEEISDELGVKPVHLLSVMMSESGVYARAHNPNGNASGLIQFMPFVLRNLGWTQGHEAFRQLPRRLQRPEPDEPLRVDGERELPVLVDVQRFRAYGGPRRASPPPAQGHRWRHGGRPEQWPGLADDHEEDSEDRRDHDDRTDL